MPDVVGIRFKRAGTIYYFDPAGIPLEVGEQVVVDTTHGLTTGKVVIAAKQVLASELAEPLKPVLRKAEPEDLRLRDEFMAQEAAALATCETMAARLGLPMKMLRAEYNFDGSRLTFFFSAEGRVDFRALVRELTSAFKTRVELRQVGARDEAKLIGDFGRCGRPLCCVTHLCSFDGVSMKMAKEQDLPLNPSKISGVCGRLLCCLSYESELYRALKEKMPRVGLTVATPTGPAKVVGGNAIKETVLVQLESGATVELPLTQVMPGRPEAASGQGERSSRK